MRRIIYKNKNGVSPVIETLVAVGISVALLAVFFTSATNLYTVYDTPNVDLQAKSIGIIEALLNSPGRDTAFNPSWESDYQNVSVVGLGTSKTITYGVVHINDQGESTIISQYNFSNSSSGIVATCFLEGTKIVMADCLYKNIEDIKVGDMVKSFDEENGRLVDRRVTRVFHHAPEEMSDYYLIINDFLRITPSHLIYSDEKWIYADDLKTGDSLFYPCSDYKIHSIEKVFKEEPTYDFEVGVNHNYFVALDTSDVLVHNQEVPVARFSWFDMDGLGDGTDIFFNADESTGEGLTYYWDWDYDPDNSEWVPDNSHVTRNNFGTAERLVALYVVEESVPSNIVVHTVQANTVNPPDVDERPWVLTGKDVYPDRTFVPYGKDHYIKYTPLRPLEEGYYLFEIKEKTTSTYNILDFEKIENLSNVYYSVAKSALGINESESAICEFNISVVTTVNEIDVVTYTYGASHEGAYALESTTREVLIYHKPEVKEDYTIDKPYYETGRIIVRVFIGGLAPTDSPVEPDTGATFGYETEGGSGLYIGEVTVDPLTGSVGRGSCRRGTTYSPLSSGTLSEMHAFIQRPDGKTYNYRLTLAIFEEDGEGANSHKLIEEHTTGWIRTKGWVTITGFSQSITAGTNYILAAVAEVIGSAGESVTINLGYDDLGTNRYYEEPVLSSGFRDPWNRVEAGTGRNYSIYCTYTTNT